MSDISRIITKLDEYLDAQEYDKAIKHLDFWLADFEITGNHGRRSENNQLTILNEQIGLYRKLAMNEKCLETIEKALALADKMQLEDSVGLATTLLNAATGYKACGLPEKALPLYRKAQTIYEENLSANDSRLAGLYNNMALALMDLSQYDEAEMCYKKALSILADANAGGPGQAIADANAGKLEQAITYCNLADLTAAKFNSENAQATDDKTVGNTSDEEKKLNDSLMVEKKIDEYLSKAEELLDSPEIAHDGYYAYVCENCGPVFGYYGYFMAEQKYAELAKTIRENIKKNST